jgi:hypothetical protein
MSAFDPKRTSSAIDGLGDAGRVRAFAKELVELSPDIIVGYATPSVLALQRETCVYRKPKRERNDGGVRVSSNKAKTDKGNGQCMPVK